MVSFSFLKYSMYHTLYFNFFRVFQDAQTHERLNANSKEVFEPGPWYEVHN